MATTAEDMPAQVGFQDEHMDVDDDPFADANDDYDSDLTSLSSTVKDHVYENGRRYHAFRAGQYLLPNDEKEQRHLDTMHHLCNLVTGGRLHLVELPTSLHRVLDVGTGTGIWAVDFADAHPEAHVIGVDLSPIQPDWVPSNCSFEVDNIEEPWMWKHPFDFIHSRNIGQGLRDWATYTKRMYDALSPGGVVQLVEAEGRFYSDDNSIPKGGFIEQYESCLDRSMPLAGLDRDPATSDLAGHLRRAGFQDVKVIIKKVPLGIWPRDPYKKELGKWGLAQVNDGLRSYSAALFTRFLSMSTEEVEKICAGAFEEFKRKGVHVYYRYWFVEGRK